MLLWQVKQTNVIEKRRKKLDNNPSIKKGGMPKVLHIGYGVPLVWRGGELYKIGLMKELVRQGWAVTAFLAGRYDFKLRPYLRYSSGEGVRFIELRNSPHPYYNIRRRTDPLAECNSPIIEHFTARVLREEKPDIVHIHDLKMFSASVIDLIVGQEIPVVKSLYNYWDICPQGNLLYRGEERCLDFKEGEKCVDCLQSLGEEYFPFMPQVFDSVKVTPLYPLAKRLWLLARLLRSKMGSLPPAIKKLPFPPQSYHYRRNFFIQRLNKLPFVLCPEAMGQIFINYGVAKEKIYPSLTSAVDLERILPKPLRDDRLPIIFGFFGGDDRRKGIHLLLDAFQSLEKDKARLLIYGETDTLLPRYTRYRGIEARGWFEGSRFNEVLAEIDVGIVPSLTDPCPAIISEFLKARIPVIGSDVDGIPELLKYGEYGMLCKANDVNNLAAQMKRFIEQPALVRRKQEQIALPKTMAEYTSEIGLIYQRLIDSHNRGLKSS